MNRKLRSLALRTGLVLSGFVLGVNGENWIRPDLTGLDQASVRSAVQHDARQARDSHWVIGWAYAIRNAESSRYLD